MIHTSRGPMSFQFFAEPAADPTPVGNPEPSSDPASGATPQSDPAKFTQEQVTAMMATEKRTARQALLKELGFDIKDEKNVKQAIADAKKVLDANKTQSELDAQARQSAETAKEEAETKAARLEMQVEALKAKVKPEYLDDVITLALTKVSETTPMNAVLEDMKTKYPVFFGEEAPAAPGGTGNPTNPPRKPTPAAEGMGQRLAKSSKPTVKSTYFKN